MFALPKVAPAKSEGKNKPPKVAPVQGEGKNKLPKVAPA